MNEILAKYTSDTVAVEKDLHYDTSDNDAFLDIYRPKGKYPTTTIVWVHGGGWLAGNKDDNAPWANILASKGFTVAMVGYSLAPEKNTIRFPSSR